MTRPQAHRLSDVKPRPSAWDAACGCQPRVRIRFSRCGEGNSACGPFCQECDFLFTGSPSALWGHEWMVVAALSVACKSDCDLHPTEVMKVLNPELYVGPGMIIGE